MGKCMFMRKGSVHSEPVNFQANFADNTWEQIIKACQSGSVPDTWVVGDQKTMTINGTSYAIDIIGRNHDTYAAGGIAPLTFQMHDCYATAYPLHYAAVNKWNTSDMRTKHLPAILALMPSEVQGGIKEVSKKTAAGEGSSSIVTTSDKLFLLSEVEVTGGNTYSYAGEGTRYAYYKAGNSDIKYRNGTNEYWRLRSPQSGGYGYSCHITSYGGSWYSNSSTERGVAFAFCF